MNLYLVTGSSKGLGAALFDALSRDAGNVVIGFSRAAEKLDAPVNIQVDLADLTAIEAATAKCDRLLAARPFERAVLFNNAGVVLPVDRFDRLDAQATAANIHVNLVAPLLLTRWFANATREKARQRLVVNISSGAAKRAIAGWSAYCAAKAGLEMATRVAALEADDGFTICSLAPGVVDTPMQAVVRSADREAFPDVDRFQAMKAEGALRPAADVAEAIIRLLTLGKLNNGGNFDIRELDA